MKRLWIIAWREYVSYVRTVGFWLSMLLMPMGLALGATLPALMEGVDTPQTVAVVDLTGRAYTPRLQAAVREREARTAAYALRFAATTAAGPNAGDAVQAAFERGGEAAARAELARVAPGATSAAQATGAGLTLVAPPAQAAAAGSAEAAGAVLRPYVGGERTLAGGARLTGAAVLHLAEGRPALDVWAANLADDSVRDTLEAALEQIVREDELRALGVDPARLAALERRSLQVRTLSPRAADGEVSLRDRLPSLVGFAMGMLLWSVVLTGAGILLNSVIEEKASRILEVLLASASTTEIMGGKILGVAMVTLTVLGVWGGLGGALAVSAAPGLAADLGAVLLGQGFLPYFALYLVGGYLMYAAAFAAMGAFCETTREAQTLLGPVMILLTVPVLFMTTAIRNPESETLAALSWVPPFTPFIMAARAGGHPAWWEIAGTTAVMALTTAGVLWLSARAFRAGALSTAKLEPRAMLAAFRSRLNRRA